MSNTGTLDSNTSATDKPTQYINNPFIGLRAFEENESHLFFGRDKPIDDLSKRLIQSRFMAVIGSSGSGKSSLVKSGLLPNIFSGFFTEGTNWRVALMRPSENPIGYLAEALTEKKSLFPKVKKQGDIAYQSAIEATLKRSENGLIQVYKEAFGLLQLDEINAPRKKTDNLLIVVDQFEELFRFRKIEKEKHLGVSDAQHFIKILLTAAQQSEYPIYVLITMRSDFLGDCSEFVGLPEAINDGQYLVPRMTRDEIRECITRPVALSTFDISPRLVTRLLNDINNDMDQLPILQHTMMRTWEACYNRITDYHQTAKSASNYTLDEWEKWLPHKWESLLASFDLSKEELELKKVKWDKRMRQVWQQYHPKTNLDFETWFKENQKENPVDLEDYYTIGTWKDALSNHAEKAFEELKTPEEEKICELMFKALTDKTADARGTRRLRSVFDLSKLCNATHEQIINIVEIFRKPGRTFLMPPVANGPLKSDSIIDISHESLMRLWKRLIQWTEEEAQDSDTFKRLADDTNRYHNGKGSLWVNPELEIGLKWKEKFNNDDNLIAVWAKSFNADAEKALKFLEESKVAANALKEEKERLIREEKQREIDEANRIKEEELKEQKRKEEEAKRKRNWLIAFLVLAFIAAIFLALFGYKANKSAKAAELAELAAIKERDKATKSDSLAQIDKRKAQVSDSLAQKDKRKAEISDSIAQINADVAMRARDKAELAEAEAKKQEEIAKKSRDESLLKSKSIALNEYLRLIRTGPTDKSKILANDFDYKVVAYAEYINLLDTPFHPNSWNNELYEKLYYSLIANNAESKAFRATSEKYNANLDLADNVTVAAVGYQLEIKNTQSDSVINTKVVSSMNNIKAVHVNKKDKLVICATSDNMITVLSYDGNYKLTIQNKIPMGALVTALDYDPSKNIIYFGLVSGEIGYILYGKDKKNQPVYDNLSDISQCDKKTFVQEISAVDYFSQSDKNYLLATSINGKAVLYKLDQNQFKPNEKLSGIELPINKGEITAAHYDELQEAIILEIKNEAYIWNPFVSEVQEKLKKQLDVTKYNTVKTNCKFY